MSTLTIRNRSTQGTTIGGRKKLQLKDRKYGAQVSKLRAGQKVTASTERVRRGIYDTLRSLNINANFRTRKVSGKFVISKKYSTAN